jgi:plastocyanin
MTLVHRSWRRLGFAIALFLAAGAVAVPALAASGGVSIVDKTFDPAKIEVHVGDTVTWTVTKSIGEPHSVTQGKPSDTGAKPLFDSGLDKLKDDGSSFSFTFETAGTYDYFCTVHPTVMTGQVVVSAPGESGAEAGKAPVPPERKLIGAGILVVALIVLFAAARVWRRMNPA